MLRLYMDVHVPGAVTRGLAIRGVDVLTAQDDGARRLPDPELLDRAGDLGRVLFSQDDDLLQEAARRQRAGIEFGGVVYMHQLELSIGQCIADLELICCACDPDDLRNQVWYLPLR